MPFVEINPRYREFLQRQNLSDANAFLALPGVIVCGHSDRHVARVELGCGAKSITAFLKREHRILWRDWWESAWAGFGCVSQSRREAALLRQLRRAGVSCPEWIAAGEDGRGRAFLLVREIGAAQTLRQFLNSPLAASAGERRRLAQLLGETLAHVHEAGFDHPDLTAKHILVEPENLQVHILDWQRARRSDFVGGSRRWRNLAALHATLGDHLADRRDRLACLRAYLRATIPGRPPREFRRRARRAIEQAAQRLLRHRHIRDLRRAPVDAPPQQLLWLDGEALCVTPEMQAAFRDRPSWLPATDLPQGVTQRTINIPGAAPATLVCRRRNWSLSALWAWMCGKRVSSPEARQAGLLFRLQRHNLAAPRLLAFGQRRLAPWQTESFLLTENVVAIPLAEWLARPINSSASQPRRTLIRAAGTMLRGLHEAGWGVRFPADLRVRELPDGEPSLAFGGVETLYTQRHRRASATAAELTVLWQQLAPCGITRTDALRFLLAYVQSKRLTAEGRQLARAATRAGRHWFGRLLKNALQEAA